MKEKEEEETMKGGMKDGWNERRDGMGAHMSGKGEKKERGGEFTPAWSIKSNCASRLSCSAPCFLSMWSFDLVKSHREREDG